MFLTLVPLFDEKMAVKAYSVFTQKDNIFLNPLSQGTSRNDGATNIQALEVISTMGLDTLSDDTDVFVPLTNISIFADVDSQCPAEHERICFLIDNSIPPIDMYISRLKELKAAGYKLAMRKLPVNEFQVYQPILELLDYLLLNNKKIAIDKAQIFFGKLYPNISLVAGNIDSQDNFDKLVADGGYTLYEGDFYRIPVTKGKHEVAPVKVTYLELIKIVNNPDFELTDAADVISRDPALTISLLQMVNKVVKTAEITTIRHAAAMLGQRELKRWINTAAASALYADKPGEMTRLSLLRARFAENLAGVFGMKLQSEELFLLGLFSVLDVILEMPMEEALNSIQVSKQIREALVNRTGALAEVYELMLQYETADWAGVSRTSLLRGLDINKIYEAYLDSLRWYRELLPTK